MLRRGIFFRIIFTGSVLAWTTICNADWYQLGSPINAGATMSGQSVAIAVGNTGGGQALYAAYDQFYNNSIPPHHIYVKHWNGSAWEQTGPMVNSDSNEYCENPYLLIDAGGAIKIAYFETVPSYGYCLFTKRLNGSSWVNLTVTASGISPDDYSYAQYAAMAADGFSNQFLSYSDNSLIQTYNGTTWNNNLGTVAIDHTNLPTHSLVVDNNNHPYLAWYTLSPNNVHVRHWVGVTPSDEPDATFKNTTHFPTGSEPFLLNDPTQGLYLTFIGSGGAPAYCIPVFHYNGTAWSQVGAYDSVIATSDSLYSPRLAMDSNHALYIAWTQWPASREELHVKKLTGTTWTDVGGILNVTTNYSASNPSIAVVNDVPVVVWEEYEATGNTKNIYAKQWLVPAATATVTPVTTPLPTLTPTVDIKGALKSVEIAAFPNPASARVNFAFNTTQTGDINIHVYNTRFRLVKELKDATSTGVGNVVWDVSGISPGIYFYQLTIGTHKYPKQKLVIAR